MTSLQSTTSHYRRPHLVLAAAALVVTAGIAACSPPNEEASEHKVDTAQESSHTAEAPATPTSEQDAQVAFTDAVVRATEDGDDMASIFGTLVNSSDKDIAVTGFESSADAKMNQIHEVVDGQMQEMSSPLVIPAHGETKLEPGSTHFMLMELGNSLEPGEDVDVTLQTTAGEIAVGSVPVRTMGAGAEGYDDLSSESHHH